MKRIVAVALFLAAPAFAAEDASGFAAELARTIVSEQQYNAMIDATVEQGARALPPKATAEERDQFAAAMRKSMPTYSENMDFCAGLFVKYYTLDELKELAAFYKSPLGRKTIRIMPELQRDALGFAMERVQRNLPALLKDLGAKHPRK